VAGVALSALALAFAFDRIVLGWVRRRIRSTQIRYRSLSRVSIHLAGDTPSAQWWELDEPFGFVWRGVPYEAPVTMDLDGASIPRLLWSLAGDRWAPKVAPGATAHDYLYASGVLPRLEADRLFFEALLAHGHDPIWAWLYWKAVHWFGWLVWCRHPGRPWTFAGPACPNEVDLDDHEDQL